MTLRLIYPMAHRVFINSFTPSFVDCSNVGGGSCRICRKVEVGKNLKALDLLVRKMTA